ncbi:hypothetical protein BLNAU_2086 [Blattamonas nauphoetae]|uniref:Uncharacterized protein n=1 Tax=Blattamonas nauphoetae TaxID=2049346 RepID=A0ABQ9YH34_9EUKA|nr:hypothetical protein BLNAU_2086 [Blattamonas nauphoetae]
MLVPRNMGWTERGAQKRGTSGSETTSASFSHCHFTGAAYKPSARPLTFKEYPGTISIESCLFTNIVSTASEGGIVYVNVTDQFNSPSFTAKSSNFTSCSPKNFGAMYISVADDVLIESCRFESCSTTASYSEGAGLSLGGSYKLSHVDGKKFNLVSCVFEDCTAATRGGAVSAATDLDVSIVDSIFEHCTLFAASGFTLGGGVCVNQQTAFTVERSHFIDCSSRNGGGAISFNHHKDLSISDTLVKGCYSGTTGAICILRFGNAENLSFSHVLFVGNSIGDDTSFFPLITSFPENTPKFPDLAIYSNGFTVDPTLKFNDSFTTIHPDSSGMIKGQTQLPTYQYIPERHFDPAFNSIGPLLTAKPTARVNEKTGKIELEMEGKTPLASQEYEVTVKEDSTEIETRLRMLFSDGTGTLVSTSDVDLKYNTGYTIASIVGIVSDSSSSRMTNDITIPVAAWAFNLAATPSFVSFTTPDQPPTLIASPAHLTSPSQPFAFVILMFDRQVSGSYDIVVEEEGKDVTITVPIVGNSVMGESDEFVVVGDDRLLAHDTTYTIKSLSPTPGTEDVTTPVGMNKTITFHIPKSSYVPPEEPTDPEDPTTPEPEDAITVVVARGGSDSIAECGGADMPCGTVWTGQMCGKGKGGEWMNVSVRGEAEMGEGFWILGKVGMTLSSESPTQRSRVVIGRSSFSSNDGIVSISSGTGQVTNLNVIVPSSEERSSSGWVFVVDSEGDLEMSSIRVIGEGEIGVGLAKVKSGISRFTSVSMSSGSFGSGVGMIVGEGKWNSISMLICDFVVRDTTTSNAPLISFSSLSPESSFSMEGSRFQKTHRMIGSSSSSLSDADGLIEVSTAQSRTSISESVFESSGVVDGTGTITHSALHITLNSSSASSCSLAISSFAQRLCFRTAGLSQQRQLSCGRAIRLELLVWTGLAEELVRRRLI